jgi:ribonuclease E
MLIDATHPEETRVAVVDGTRLEEFDFEMAARRQIKSNIYLAKVTRVEPSLQAAFVEYGGNRHGFLPFPEIHPDYYRIPVGDRQFREDTREDRWVDTPYVAADSPVEAPESAADAAENAEWRSSESDGGYHPDDGRPDDGSPDEGSPDEGSFEPTESEAAYSEAAAPAESEPEQAASSPDEADEKPDVSIAATAATDPIFSEEPAPESETLVTEADSPEVGSDSWPSDEAARHDREPATAHGVSDEPEHEAIDTGDEGATSSSVSVSTTAGEEIIDVVGGDEVEDAQRRRRSQMPHYKIQEVIKRRQIMLVQVSKEERGNKGAAVTTFLSLPGRYCVLMPNTSRGGGVSRKIANPADRKRMKELISDLEVPDGMSVILRTAGVERSKAEIKRDLEYLLRLWENIRTLTLESTAPALIYEEGNLVKRAIRDLYTKDIDSIEIAGEEGYRQAKDFMRMLMPSHAKRVQPYRDPSIPLFFRYQVESQIDIIHNPVAHLKSGGYIVINQTEALVSIDVNSGRSTRERNIEETALKTNLEAADEIARQLRLRDMGGLIVVDFIDMDEPRHDAQVERRLKEAMKNDRARIQVGRISPFGLLELSRQRLHPSLIETHFHTCAHCLGTGLVRSIESASLLVLRAIEEEGIKRRSAELAVSVAGNIALYILNQKRGMLIDIEQRYGFSVRITADDSLIAPEHRIERVRMKPPGSELAPLSQTLIMSSEPEDDDEQDEIDEAEALSSDGGESGAGSEIAGADGVGPDGERKRKRRRNRRRRGRDGRPEDGATEGTQAIGDDQDGESFEADEHADKSSEDDGAPLADEDRADEGRGDDAETGEVTSAQGLEIGTAHAGETPAEGARRRRRGRRGGRSRARREDGRVGALPDSEDAPTDETDNDATAYDDGADETPTSSEIVASDETSVESAPATAEIEATATAEPEPEPEPENGAEDVAPPSESSVAEVAPAIPDETPAAIEATSEPEPPPAPVARAYEVVNQPPAQPRRGFWKRLVE